MKKLSLFAVLVTIASLSMTAAVHADRYHGGGDGGLSAFLVTLDLYSLSTLAANDDRAVYVQQIHEDAAAYLAEGTETALLEEAMANSQTALQAHGKTAASNTELATALMALQ